MAAPTGGTITTDGLYTVHTFTSSGDFVVDYWKPGATAWILVVGGGGNGYNQAGGPGGGGGGVKQNLTYALTTGTYSVTVGGGEQNSVFGTITATKGNRGTPYPDLDGGSSGADSSTAGGDGQKFADYKECGGGGGGSASAGGASTSTKGGNGGAGTLSTIYNGTNRYYGGGGGGGGARDIPTGGDGGLGGGGAGGGADGTGSAGTANTGGGGGGKNGAGASGIVIIRYLTSNAIPASSGFFNFF